MDLNSLRVRAYLLHRCSNRVVSIGVAKKREGPATLKKSFVADYSVASKERFLDMPMVASQIILKTSKINKIDIRNLVLIKTIRARR